MERFLICVVMAVLVCGCGLDDDLLGDTGNCNIEFSSSRMRIITKSGDEAVKFADGTKFRLFAVQNGTEWSAGGTKLYDVEGTGDNTGYVDYSIMVDGKEKKASYDVGKNLDFYGVTYGTAENVLIAGSPGSAPQVTVSLSDGTFPDLMYSSNLKDMNSSSGILNMEYRHTMSKLKFEVLKQDESADSDRKLTDVVLKKVVLKGSASEAVFDVKSGGWRVVSAADRPVYENAEGLKVTTSAQTLQNDGAEIGMIVIPNVTELYVEVTVDIDGNPDTDDDKVISYRLMASETEFLRLDQNHEYTLSIVILKNDVRIVTVTPKVYDWVDVDLGDVAYFGQPVYFGGLMWMDRNLGASSADCENDWFNSLGYYYQFGRNIPYMVDVDAYLADSKRSWTFVPDRDAADPDAVFTMKYIYTYDNNGNRVITAKHANHSSGSCLYGNAAMNPGDPGDYSYIRGYIYKNSGGDYVLNSSSWAKQNRDFEKSDDRVVNGSFDNHIFWQTIENQPCPRGWRLPSKSDMFSFMPESTKLYWLDEYQSGDMLDRIYDTNHDGKLNKDDTNQANFVQGNKNAAGEIYQWKYFAGRFMIDPSADKSMDYTCPVSDKDDGRVYGIKYEGEDKAYRIMVEQRPSVYSGRKYVRISRFEAKADDRFEMSPDGTRWNIHKFDWETPVEYMDIPLAGFMYESGMSDFGTGTILRAVEGDGNGTNWTLYLRSGHNGIAVGGGSRRNLGENIRCVRDVNAK